MPEIKVTDASREFSNFKTWRIERDGVMIGAVQCVGPCFGLMRKCDPNKHGPYISFVGSNMRDAMNLAGAPDDFEEAVNRVVEGAVINPTPEPSTIPHPSGTRSAPRDDSLIPQ